jgi:hypothetical protein
MLTLEKTTSLAPALVLAVLGPRLQIELDGEYLWATSAIAFPYSPVPGDTVLTIGQNGLLYVIGVIKATGATTMTVPGDFEIRAPRGRISLAARDGIQLNADEVQVKAKRLELVATAIFERCVEVTRWVQDVVHLRAGRLRTRVEGSYDVAAERVVVRAKNKMEIDGEKVHLG